LYKRIGVAVLTLTLTACATTQRHRRSPAGPKPPAQSLQSLPAAGTYRIDASQSELRILVYRGGTLAHLGHNHVLVNHALIGSVQVGGALASSSFALRLPVGSFVVDDAQARQEEGADFPGEIAPEAKAGTQRNMLSAALLNGARYPDIEVKSASIGSSSGAPSATLVITIAGHDATVEIPFTLRGDAAQLAASGAFELRQTALGITPYSLMGGALQVVDAMQIKFKLVALRD
jgi:YceI-like domain